MAVSSGIACGILRLTRIAGMLETLRITNYALIDAAEIEFRPGFNALTGETGAGKSILLGALNLVLGARASAGALREGAERAAIEAVFHIPHPSPPLAGLLDSQGIALEDERLIVSRQITADGRSRAYAGGMLVPLATLEAIGDELVDLHGQHEHQSLLKTERQRALLDAYGGLQSLAAKVAVSVGLLRAAERELESLDTDDRERARRADFLRHAVGEIDKAELREGEEEELRAMQQRAANAEAIVQRSAQVYAALYENEAGAAIDLIGRAARELDELAELDIAFRPLAEQAANIRELTSELARDAQALGEATEFDAEQLDRAGRRLAQLGDLRRKYGSTIGDVLAYRDASAAELDTLERYDEKRDELQREIVRLEKEARAAAEQLSAERKKHAARLDKEITKNLQDLGMKGARFAARFEAIELGAYGIDRIEFELAANIGEPMGPLRRVASGGEISRVMLALKAAFATADTIPVLIFDEIDAGVGGAVARMVGQKLAALGKTHQVICITHIPQIAALASAHYQVAKQTRAKRTITSIAAVNGEERVAEVARLLDGSISAVSLEHARTLLAERKA